MYICSAQFLFFLIIYYKHLHNISYCEEQIFYTVYFIGN